MSDTKEMIYHLDVNFQTRWYPKAGKPVNPDDWQICRVKVINHVEPVDENFETTYGQITILGNMPVMEKENDEVYRIKVRKEWNEKYEQWQYTLLYARELREFKTDEQKRAFLQMFISPRQIESLYKVHKDPLELIDKHDIEELCKAGGIGQTTAQKIIDKYESCKDYGVAYGELGAMGVSPAYIKRLIDRYGSADSALQVVMNNPYVLAEEVDGVGFIKADEIALQNGIGKHDIRRVKSYIIFAMNEYAMNTGSSYLMYDELLDKIDDVLGTDLPQDTIDEAMRELLDKKYIWCKEKPSGEFDENGEEYFDCIVALKEYYTIEKEIARHIKRLLNGSSNINFTPEEIDEMVKPKEQEQGWQFTDMQKCAMRVVADSNVSIIRGYGGTGKTASVGGLISCVKITDPEYFVQACALSGKAAININDVSDDLEGYTIHRLLGYAPGQGFTSNEESPLEADMVILDEASMVDVKLFLSLLKAIPTGSKLVMLGDTNQLEAIGVGNILMDLIDSEMVPTVTFTEIHRQAAKSGIIPFSIDVAQGICRYKDSWVGEEVLGELQDLKVIGYKVDRDEEKPSIDIIIQEYKEMYKECKDVSQISVVLPTKSRGTGCYKVNKLIQDFVLPRRARGKGLELGTKNEPFTLYKGDKIINLKNNYDLGIFNGNMGEIINVNVEEKWIEVEFYNQSLPVRIVGKQLEAIDLGYAITCHKSQGSTIPYVIYCLDNTHYVMLNRGQCYTGITRAKKRETLVIETKAMNRAIRTNFVSKKRNFLYHFMIGDLD